MTDLERIDEQQWRAAGQYGQHRGHRIFFRDSDPADARPALILIHGFPTASWDWAPIWPALCERYRVIAQDMIGFGWSDKPRNYAYSIMDQADLHEGLLSDLGVRKALVLAHDYGDTVAQELLARDLERRKAGQPGFEIQALCLLNGGLFPELHRARLIQKLLNSPIGGLVSALSSERVFRRSFSAVFGPQTQPSPADLASFWAMMLHQNGHRISHLLIRYIRDRRRHRARWVGALQQAVQPLRLINGLLDPVSGAHMVQRYRELVPDPDVVELPGVGHYPQVEAPQEVLEAALAFFDAQA